MVDTGYVRYEFIETTLLENKQLKVELTNLEKDLGKNIQQKQNGLAWRGECIACGRVHMEETREKLFGAFGWCVRRQFAGLNALRTEKTAIENELAEARGNIEAINVMFDEVQLERDETQSYATELENELWGLSAEHTELVDSRNAALEGAVHFGKQLATLRAELQQALKERDEMKAIHDSLNSNLRKLGSGEPFVPAVEIAQLQAEVVQLSRDKKRALELLQKPNPTNFDVLSVVALLKGV